MSRVTRLEGDGEATNREQAALECQSALCTTVSKDVNDTHDVVVRAAHRVGGASIARTNADDRDRGAVETDQTGYGPQDDPEQAQEEISTDRVGL